MDFKSKHYHIVYPQYYEKDKYSWYVQDKDFYDKKPFIGFSLQFQNQDTKPNSQLFTGVEEFLLLFLTQTIITRTTNLVENGI